eukprot:TRINITY_DN4869_c0_g1_i1.p2 TRINITY_DN4869_c0_g1~~TRINITY_DN4869_c0_g1_i1.p2  ORF type:complete len:59 (+),score=8.94 TRINITY_DN4869_c0_g1_i1:120-296(+)
MDPGQRRITLNLKTSREPQKHYPPHQAISKNRTNMESPGCLIIGSIHNAITGVPAISG